MDQNILFLLPFMLSDVMVERRWHIQTGQLKLQVCTCKKHAEEPEMLLDDDSSETQHSHM